AGGRVRGRERREVAERRDLQTTQWLAGLPFHDRFVLGFGHTVQFGRPIFEDGHLRHFLLLNTLVKIDARLFDDFHAVAHPVDLLWIVPLSEREYRLKREQGIDGSMPVFAENAHPVTVDKQRGRYLGGEGA
ncbi:suppressor of fused domain protein, partial [Pseudomonas aeruginosa]|uniref:suppressor of fused domain protein n=2 Tax=Pseudomonas aeruginosa TaxID=287 RepID=UPI0021A9589C